MRLKKLMISRKGASLSIISLRSALRWTTIFRVFAFCALIVGFAAACDQSFPTWNCGNDFSVIVTMDKRPMKGMRVILKPYDEKRKNQQIGAITNESGVANFTGINLGRYYVEASRLGIEVGPGTIVVTRHGISGQIPVEWPLRPEYVAATVAGHFQRRLFSNRNPIEGYAHPRIGPVSDAKLTLSRIDSEMEIATVPIDADGTFAFPPVEPGYYLLHVEQKKSPEFAYPLNDYLVVEVDPASPRDRLNLQLNWTSCGMTATEIR